MNKALVVVKMLRKATHLSGALRSTKDLRAVLARLETAPHQYDEFEARLEHHFIAI